MKKRFSRIAGVIAACVIIALLLSYLTVLTVWKETYKERAPSWIRPETVMCSYSATAG